MFLIGFPLLIIPLAIYNMIAFLTPGVPWTDPLAKVRLPSEADWTMTFGDSLIGLALLLLLVEILKARLGSKSVVDHLLSIIVFALAAAEFLLVTQAATSTFAVLAAICLVDAGAGFSKRKRPVAREPVAPPAAVVAHDERLSVREAPAARDSVVGEPAAVPEYKPVRVEPPSP